MLRSALPFILWVMLPNSSRSKVNLKLTATYNKLAPYANNFLSNSHTCKHAKIQTEELTGVDFRSAAV